MYFLSKYQRIPTFGKYNVEMQWLEVFKIVRFVENSILQFVQTLTNCFFHTTRRAEVVMSLSCNRICLTALHHPQILRTSVFPPVDLSVWHVLYNRRNWRENCKNSGIGGNLAAGDYCNLCQNSFKVAQNLEGSLIFGYTTIQQHLIQRFIEADFQFFPRKMNFTVHAVVTAVQRGAFCQFLFRRIYYCHSKGHLISKAIYGLLTSPK